MRAAVTPPIPLGVNGTDFLLLISQSLNLDVLGGDTDHCSVHPYLLINDMHLNLCCLDTKALLLTPNPDGEREFVWCTCSRYV